MYTVCTTHVDVACCYSFIVHHLQFCLECIRFNFCICANYYEAKRISKWYEVNTESCLSWTRRPCQYEHD